VDIGSSPATGGTAAIQFDTGVAGKTLTINAGVTVVARGDVIIQSTTAPYINRLIVNGTLSLTPGAGKRYDVKCENFTGFISVIGTAGNYAEIKTDLSGGGDPGRITVVSGASDTAGLTDCDYGRFTDLGDTSNFGVKVYEAASTLSATYPISITNSRFVRTSFRGDWIAGQGGGFPWDGNVTFQGNIFTDSVMVDVTGTDTCALFRFLGPTTKTWLVTENSFDEAPYLLGYTDGIEFSRNVAPFLYFDNSADWSDETQFTDNLFIMDGGELVFGVGNSAAIQRCYIFNEGLGLPHSMAVLGDGAIIKDCVGETLTSTTDATFTSVGHSHDYTITGCLGIFRSGAGVFILPVEHDTPGFVTAEHNTCVGAAEFIRLGKLGEAPEGSFAGFVASCRSNLVTRLSGGNIYVAAHAVPASAVVDAVTLSRYNAVLNPASGTCKYNNGNTTQNDVVGYSGVRITPNTAFPNATVGNNDFTIIVDPFLDSGNGLAEWGAAIGGTDGTLAAAKTYAFANPAIATADDTGVLDWVRSKYRVTDVTLQDAGHDGETIGAGEFVASSSGDSAARMRLLLRP
jgi:hypothetical protein